MSFVDRQDSPNRSLICFQAVTVPKVGEDRQGVWSGDLCMCTDCQFYDPGTAPQHCTLECQDCPSGDI